jgi:hypothetical protein
VNLTLHLHLLYTDAVSPFAGVPTNVLGIQGRGCLLGGIAAVTHLATLGAEMRNSEQVCLAPLLSAPRGDLCTCIRCIRAEKSGHAALERVFVRGRVRSPLLHVRRLVLSANLLQTDIPAEQMMSFFRSLCKHLLLLSQDVSQMLRLMAERQRNVTRDLADTSAIQRDRFITEVIARNELPMHCRVLKQCDATLLPEGAAAQLCRNWEGKLLVFLDWLVFVPTCHTASTSDRDLKKDLLIDMLLLDTVSCHKGKLKITNLCNQAQTLHINSSSITSTPAASAATSIPSALWAADLGAIGANFRGAEPLSPRRLSSERMIGTQHNHHESGPASTSVGGMIDFENNFNCAGVCDSDTSSLVFQISDKDAANVQKLIASRVSSSQIFKRETRGSGDGGGENAAFRHELRELGFLLPDEQLSEREIAVLSQLLAKSSWSRFAPGEVIVEAGACTRSVLLLIHGTIVSRIPDTSTSSDVVEVRCASRPGRLPECAPSNLQHSGAHSSSLNKPYSAQTLVQDRFIGEESLLQGSNMGSAARLLALSEVQCLVLSLDVLEMLWCNEPLVGIRFFRNVAMTLGRRIQRQMNCLFASADLTPSPLLENVDNLETLFDGTPCTRLTPAAGTAEECEVQGKRPY